MKILGKEARMGRNEYEGNMIAERTKEPRRKVEVT